MNVSIGSPWHALRLKGKHFVVLAPFIIIKIKILIYLKNTLTQETKFLLEPIFFKIARLNLSLSKLKLKVFSVFLLMPSCDHIYQLY